MVVRKKKNEGRKLPTIIKKQRGTLRSDRSNPKEPEFENAMSIPLPPDNIKTEYGKQVWWRCAGQLHGVGLMFSTAGDMLALYCRALERMREAEELIIEYGGMIYENDKGNYVKNPALTIYNEAFTQAFNLGREFGFTPISKSKLVTGAGDSGSNKAKKKTSLRKAT